jgi:hypothetical protein
MAYPRIGKWVSFEIDISDSTTISDECDLGAPYEYMLLEVPTLTTGTLSVQILRASAGTARNAYSTDADGSNAQLLADSSSGAFIWIVPIHGAQYIKVTAGAAQAADRTFWVRGVNRYLSY